VKVSVRLAAVEYSWPMPEDMIDKIGQFEKWDGGIPLKLEKVFEKEGIDPRISLLFHRQFWPRLGVRMSPELATDENLEKINRALRAYLTLYRRWEKRRATRERVDLE
jgi:hypothetical protein